MTEKISVGLPSKTLYVSGTVNGVATTWTNVEGNTWESIVDKADNGKYDVHLTIISSLGQSTEANFTLYYGLNLITDRTQADVDRVRTLQLKGWSDMSTSERDEWSGSLKGAYDASDLNRVGAAVEYVVDRLTEYGYHVPVSIKNDWKVGDIPTATQLETYLQNVKAVRSAIAVFPNTPDAPIDMNKLTYVEANNIEKILQDVDQLIAYMLLAYVYSGEVYAGEV